MNRATILAGLLFCSGALAEERARIDLNGTWQFRLDPDQVGVSESWATGDLEFPEEIEVPGSWGAQGIGKPDGILRHHYSGHVWYLRRVHIPTDWEDRTVHLAIGGAYRRTQVFVNGRPVGEEYDGFSAPFAFDITSAVVAGSENVLALRLDNSGPAVAGGPREQEAPKPTGMLNYISNWGGIFGDVVLEATTVFRIESVYVRPVVSSGKTVFQVGIENRESREQAGRVRLLVEGFDPVEAPVAVQPGGGHQCRLELPMPQAHLWSPDDPFLYRARLSLLQGEREIDRVEQRFGYREITTRGPVLLLNGKPLYLRGYGDDNVEVLSGLPPASGEVYRERIRLAKSYGFNAVRFHSMTPSAAFFDAADELGLLVMAELPVAYTQYFLPHREFLRRELRAVLRAHRNRPSLLSLALGNEFNLDWLKSQEERLQFLDSVSEFYAEAKSLAPGTLILSNDGFIMPPTDMASIPRGASLDCPIVRHEFGGYYCSLPDPSLIAKFQGVIEPVWLREKERWVEEQGLSELYPVLVSNSHRLVMAGRKFQIERARLDPSVTGYHYWLIVDFPGGTGEGDSWEEGWFDYFWQPKGIRPEEGRQVNSPVLVMIDSGVADRSFWNDESRVLSFVVSNYGDAPIERGVLTWKLGTGEAAEANGEIRSVDVPLGEVRRVGAITVGPFEGGRARKVELKAALEIGNRRSENAWSFWIFPRQLASGTPRPVVSHVKRATLSRLYPFLRVDREPPAGALLITPLLDRPAAEFLRQGGRVWVLGGRDQFGRSGDGQFFPAAGGAFATRVEDHPAFRDFPHEGFCDLQFFRLLEGSWLFPHDRWPRNLQPILHAVRTQSSFLSQRKDLVRVGFLFEAGVGQGKLLFTSLRLEELLDEAYPEAIYLFDRLLRYSSGPEFDPQTRISDEELDRLVR